MLHSELVTSVQMGKRLQIILLDNMITAVSNNLQMEHRYGRLLHRFRFHQRSGRQEGGFASVDFARIAEKDMAVKAIASPPLNNCMKRWKVTVNEP